MKATTSLAGQALQSPRVAMDQVQRRRAIPTPLHEDDANPELDLINPKTP